MFPPFMPVMLGLLEKLGAGPLTAFRELNSLAIIATVCGSGVLARRYCSSRAIAFIATAFIALAPPLYSVARMGYSEPAFLAFLIAFLCLFDQCARTEVSRRLLVVTGLVGGMCFGIRYAGVILFSFVFFSFAFGEAPGALLKTL